MNNERLQVGFAYDLCLLDAGGQTLDHWQECNLIPREALTILLRAPFAEAASLGPLYIGLWGNNALPSSASKAADIPAVLGEFTQYSQAARPVWDRLFDEDTASYTNNANKAEFTFTVDKLIHGLLMTSVPEKGSPAGLLVSVAKLSTPRMIYAGTTLKVAASISYLTNSI